MNCKYLEKVRKLLTVINQNYKNIFRYVDEVDILPHNVMPSDFGYERIKLSKNEPLVSAVAEKAKRKKLTKEQKILNRKLEQAEVLRFRYLVVAKEILKILCKLRVYYQEKLQEQRTDIKASAIAHGDNELAKLCDKELNQDYDKIKRLESIYRQILDFISVQSSSRIYNEHEFEKRLGVKKTLSKEAMDEVGKINWLLNGLVKFAAHYQDQRDKGLSRKRTHYVFAQYRI